MDSTARSITMGVAATAAAAAAYYMYGSQISGGKNEPVLSHDDTVGAMVKILDGLKGVAVNLSRAAENVAQQLAQQGQEATREEIMVNIILPHFIKNFTSMQEVVLDEYDVDEEELEECVEYYLEHTLGSKLGEVVHKVRALCCKFTGEEVPASTGGTQAVAKQMSLEILFEVLGAFGVKTKEYFGRLAEDVVARVGVPSTQEEILRFSEELNLVSDKAQDEVLGVFGFEKEEFEASIMRYQQSPELMQALQQLQVDNNYALIANGIDTSRWQ
jgi:uncharacterized protein (DUF433 family)